MKTNNNNLHSASGEIKCIWMTSQQVSYKLCDREFDCENCEFDKIFRNHSTKITENESVSNTGQPGLIENIIKRIEEENFEDKLIYLRNQLVIKNLFGNAYYLGINPIILNFIENVNSIQEFPKNEIKKNQIIFTLEGNWGKKDFISPISFLIIGKISITPIKFNQNKWHSVILFNNNDMDDIQLNKSDWMQEKNSVVSYLNSQIKNKPSIGKSLMDGGEPVQYLHQYLGKKEFLKLLNGTFN
jgi:hypothetical protein